MGRRRTGKRKWSLESLKKARAAKTAAKRFPVVAGAGEELSTTVPRDYYYNTIPCSSETASEVITIMSNIKNRERKLIANLRKARVVRKAKHSMPPIALGNNKSSPATTPTPPNVSTTTTSSALLGGGDSTTSSSPPTRTTSLPSGARRMTFEVEPKLEHGESSLSETPFDESSSTTSCLICRDARGGEAEGNSSGGNNEGESSSPCRRPNEFPTCSDQDNCYREQLWSIFVLRKLLEVPREEVAALLRNTFGVNPSSWIGLCLECSGMVEVAVQLNYQIMKLERDLHKVKVKIQGKLSKSAELEEKHEIKEGDGPGILNVHQVIRDSILDGNNYRKSGKCHPPAYPASSSSSASPLSNYEYKHFFDTHHEVEDEVDSSGPEDDPLHEPELTLTQRNGQANSHRKISLRKGGRPWGLGRLPPQRTTTSVVVDDFKTEDENDDGEDERDLTDPLFIPEGSEEDSSEEDGAGINNLDGEKGLDVDLDIPSLQLTFLSSAQSGSTGDDGPSRSTNDLSKAPKLSQGKSEQGLHLSFVCAICKTNCREPQRYDRHMNNHKLYANFTCRICSFPNCTQVALNRHLALKHGIGPLRAFKLVDEIVESSSEEPGGADGKREGGYHCKFCSYSSPSARRMVDHEESHKYSDNISAVEGTTDKFHCKLCGFEGGGRSIREHIVEVHAAQVGMEPLLCHMCERVYATARALKIHIQMVHGELKYRCSVCEKGFTRPRCFREHFEKCSNGGRNPLICDVCGTTFSCASQLKRHMNKFHPEGATNGETGKNPAPEAGSPTGKRRRPTKCKHCGVQFVHDKALKVHFRTAHPELYKYKCDQCDAAYMQPGGIKTHMEAKHLKQKANCPYCYKELSCAAFLKGHWARHCKKLPPQEPASALTLPQVETASNTHNTNTI